jgi:hypothetical protein
VIIYAYNDHLRLLSPEPAVVTQPQSTWVKEPTLLCNQVEDRFPHGLARDRAGVDAHAADGGLFLNERDAFSGFDCLDAAR